MGSLSNGVSMDFHDYYGRDEEIALAALCIFGLRGRVRRNLRPDSGAGSGVLGGSRNAIGWVRSTPTTAAAVCTSATPTATFSRSSPGPTEALLDRSIVRYSDEFGPPDSSTGIWRFGADSRCSAPKEMR